MDPLRVAALQMPHGPTLEGNVAKAREMVAQAREAGATLALLPEYWFATFSAPVEAAALRAFFADASRDIALAGNLIENKLNLGVVYAGGVPVLEQPKIHPMPREAANGVVGGEAWRVAPVAGVPTGMLVCADVLYPEAARVEQLLGAWLLLNPVMSPYREVDDTKEARDAIFVARAYDAGAFLVKAGGYRRGDPAVAGRSLITAPWGVLARYQDEFAEEVLVADLDLARLERFRRHQVTFPARRPSAYQELVRG